MLTKLELANFKSWKRVDLGLARLTGFFGKNSSGKTSLLQSLLLMKQTADSPDRNRVLNTGDERTPVEVGTFQEVVHAHDVSTPLRLGLEWGLSEELSIKDPETAGDVLFASSKLRFDTSIVEAEKQILADSFSYRLDGARFGLKRVADAPETKGRRGTPYELIHEGYRVKRAQGRAWPLPPPVKCYGFPDEATLYYQNTGFLPDLVLELERLLRSIAYLGPLREHPRRDYVWTGESPVDVGRKGESAIAAILSSREHGSTISFGVKGKKKQTIEARLAHWLNEMGMIESFSIDRLAENRNKYEVRVRQSSFGAEALLPDVGFGVSQVIPVIVLLYYVPEGSIVILEQPEIHLHPFAQSALADVLIEAATMRNIQIIFESHSEHLLRRIQRRIAERTLDATDVAMYFCESAGGASRARRLEVDRSGFITNWPEQFFGDEMGDLMAMTTAMSAE